MWSDYSSVPIVLRMVLMSYRWRAERSHARSQVLRHAVAGMTSRTTPVGLLVLALTSIIAIGCNAQTSAVFEALLDPAGTSLSSPVVGVVDPTDEPAVTDTWWPHPDRYSLILPAGWSGVAVLPDETDDLVALVLGTMPELGLRVQAVVSATGLRVSAIAADPSLAGDISPVLLVLAQPTDGLRAREIKQRVRAQIGALPGLASELVPLDVYLTTGKAVRFDYTIADPDLGELRVRSYLIRTGPEVYLVNFVAGAELAEAAETIFDQIAESLQFGL
jgi:hypothetical protein